MCIRDSNSIEKYDLLVEKELKESISEIFSVNTPLEKSLKKGFAVSYTHLDVYKRQI